MIANRPLAVGEVIDRAIVLVVHNAAALFVVGGIFELALAVLGIEMAAGGAGRAVTLMLVWYVVNTACTIALAVVLDSRIEGHSIAPLQAIRSGLRFLPSALAASVPLGAAYGLLLFGVAMCIGLVNTFFGTRIEGSVTVLWPFLCVPALAAAVVVAYCVAFAGLTTVAIALDTRSPAHGLRLTFERLRSRRATSRATLVIGAVTVAVYAASFMAEAFGKIVADAVVDTVAGHLLRASIGVVINVIPLVLATAVLVVLRRDLIVRRTGVDMLSATVPGGAASRS